MSNQPSNTTNTNNAPIKIISCIIGYALWSLLSQTYHEQLELTIPVCLYNEPENYTITAPEMVTVRLQGTRATLRTLTHEQLAVHLDATTLHAGDNPLCVDAQTLFLPEDVNMLHYNATPLLITLTEKIKQPAPSTPQETTINQQSA